MSASITETDRQVFPRWRSFRTTSGLGELSSSTSIIENDTTDLDISLAKGIATWEGNPSLWNGLDLVGSAIVAGRLQEFPALLAEIRSNPLTPKVSRLILDQPVRSGDFQPEILRPTKAPDLEAQREIKQHRQNLIQSPRDAIEWLELARAYTIAGVNNKAGRAVQAALQLAPNNRFILRSAARFLIHLNKRDVAYDLLSAAPALKKDPWLLASQIAIGSSIGAKSRMLRVARATIEADFSPSDITELASVLGTLETESGKHKNGRKLFRQALIQPNENSVAQVRWADRMHLGNVMDVSNANPPRLFEANAWGHFYKGAFQDAKNEALCWLQDQPFASAPAVLSSFILADVLGEYETGRDITKAALRANPNDISLLNNLAVCLTENGELKDAEKVLEQIGQSPVERKNDAVLSATAGLLAFRQGKIEEGRRFYLEAIEHANNSGIKVTAARAAIHLALEEFLANTDAREEAMKRMNEYRNEEHILELTGLLARLDKLVKSR